MIRIFFKCKVAIFDNDINHLAYVNNASYIKQTEGGDMPEAQICLKI